MRKGWESWGCSLEKRRLHGDLTAAFQYFRVVYRKDGNRLCSRACWNRMEGNCCELKKGQFRLDGTIFFPMRMEKQ